MRVGEILQDSELFMKDNSDHSDETSWKSKTHPSLDSERRNIKE